MLRRRTLPAPLLGALVLVAAAGAIAQTAPEPLTLGHPANGRLAASAAGDCYAVNAVAGQSVTFRLSSGAFVPKLSVGRGATCAGASFQYIRSAGQEAVLTFKPAPGRYMVLVQAADGKAGTYVLASSGVSAVQMAQASDAGFSRRAVMESQVNRRRQELAEEEERQRVVAVERARIEAESEARRRQFEAEEEAARLEWEAEGEDEPPKPAVNFGQVFADSFNKAIQENAAERARQQAFLNDIARQQREAQRAREERAELARQQAAERAEQSRQLAVANTAQRQAAAEVLARQQREQQLEQNRRLEQQRLAQQQTAQQRQQKTAQQPSQGAPPSTPTSAPARSAVGGASTRPDPMTCVTRPTVSPGSLCGKGTLNISAVNGCPEPVTIMVCLKTTAGRWECGRGTKNPQEAYSYPVCNATEQSFMGAAYRDGGGPLLRPQ